MKKYKLYKQKGKLLLGAVASGFGSAAIWGGGITLIGKLADANANTMTNFITVTTALGLLSIPLTYHAFKEISLNEEDQDTNKKTR